MVGSSLRVEGRRDGMGSDGPYLRGSNVAKQLHGQTHNNVVLLSQAPHPPHRQHLLPRVPLHKQVHVKGILDNRNVAS